MTGRNGLKCSLSDLGPESSFAGNQEGVFARVPTEEMRSLRVEAMIVARSPNLVEEEGAGRVDRAVKVVSEAALFAARWGD